MEGRFGFCEQSYESFWGGRQAGRQESRYCVLEGRFAHGTLTLPTVTISSYINLNKEHKKLHVVVGLVDRLSIGIDDPYLV